MKKLEFRYFIFIYLMMFFANGYAVQQAQSFKLDSYQQILQQNKKQAFLMVLWSVECAPCMKELKILGEFHQKYPQHKLVLVSTDGKKQSDEISQLVTQYGLQTVDQWIFDDSFQYLRHSIDPNWYGELPRSYFYTQEHMRQATSGQLHAEQLIQFFSGNTKKSRLKTL